MNMDDNPEITRQIQVETSMTDILQGEEYLFLQYLNPVLHFPLFFQLQVGLLGVLAELLFRALCSHTLREYF
jgi:hypothetical protein